MKEELDCEFKGECEEKYTEEGMDEYRKDCDCVNCALCDKYWRFYDRRYFKKQQRKGGKNDG